MAQFLRRFSVYPALLHRLHGPMDAFDSSLGIDASDATRDDVPVLIDLWHPDCGACRDVRERLTTFKHRLQNKFPVGRLNIAEVPDLADELGVDRVPAVLVCRDGSVEACLRGTDEIFRFIEQIEQAVGS